MDTRTLPHPPAYEDLIWRPLWPADVPSIHRLISVLGKENGVSPAGSTEDYAAYFTDSSTSSVQDSMAAIAENGTVVALGWAMPNADYQDELRIDLWLDVYPAYHHRWLDRFLLEWLETRCAQIAANRADDRLCWMNVPSDWLERGRISTIESCGFVARHSEQTMERDLSQPIPEIVPPEGVSLVPWTRRRDELLRRTFNACFADRTGGREIGAESWKIYYSGGNLAPAETLIARHGRKGVGLTRALVSADDPTRGEIGHIAVLESWRRRGLGGALLSAALRSFQARGLKTAFLSVAPDNTPAIAAYEKLGFVTTGGYTSFRKDVQA
jgi:mycothiol synthase